MGNDYYKDLKDENYKTLLDKEIQLGYAREQALKNTNANMAAQGLASQGYGQANRLGVESAYLKGLEGAQGAYMQAANDINRQEHEADVAAANDSFQSLTTLMTEAQNSEQLDKILSEYGYMQDGKWLEDSETYKNLDDNSRKQLRVLYDLYKDQFDQNSNKMFDDYYQMSTDLTDNNGQTGKLRYEIDFLYNMVPYVLEKNNYSMNSGDVIKLVGEKNNYAYLLYKDGMYYQVDQNAYQKAKNKLILKNNEGIQARQLYYNGKALTMYKKK